MFLIAARKRSSSGDKSPKLPIAFLKRGLPLMMMTTETKGGDGVGRAKCQVCQGAGKTAVGEYMTLSK